jgi:hypothetical protein
LEFSGVIARVSVETDFGELAGVAASPTVAAGLLEAGFAQAASAAQANNKTNNLEFRIGFFLSVRGLVIVDLRLPIAD